ncbi:hypothetical protein NDU88_004010 [Pleurodeles waltl]|uniref:Uncharacterized protein n=1 Tax=Pleurodeles waltl TaxID=8319 RepID=A0AAV7VIR0_PLEWA|nr:hypothetical protein NDU88_004010 [Pleurodeles waltl]
MRPANIVALHGCIILEAMGGISGEGGPLDLSSSRHDVAGWIPSVELGTTSGQGSREENSSEVVRKSERVAIELKSGPGQMASMRVLIMRPSRGNMGDKGVLGLVEVGVQATVRDVLQTGQSLRLQKGNDVLD